MAQVFQCVPVHPPAGEITSLSFGQGRWLSSEFWVEGTEKLDGLVSNIKLCLREMIQFDCIICFNGFFYFWVCFCLGFVFFVIVYAL